MMVHLVVDGPDGRPVGAGAIPVEEVPAVGDTLTVDALSGPIELEVVETHHTSKRLSRHFTEETEWAYCRRR